VVASLFKDYGGGVRDVLPATAFVATALPLC